MINGIEAVKQQNIYRINAVNFFENNRQGSLHQENRFIGGLFTQQNNDTYNPNHPMVRGSETQAQHLDLLA